MRSRCRPFGRGAPTGSTGLEPSEGARGERAGDPLPATFVTTHRTIDDCRRGPCLSAHCAPRPTTTSTPLPGSSPLVAASEHRSSRRPRRTLATRMRSADCHRRRVHSQREVTTQTAKRHRIMQPLDTARATKRAAKESRTDRRSMTSERAYPPPPPGCTSPSPPPNPPHGQSRRALCAGPLFTAWQCKGKQPQWVPAQARNRNFVGCAWVLKSLACRCLIGIKCLARHHRREMTHDREALTAFAIELAAELSSQ